MSGDLVVLVPDKDIEQGLRGLLSRPQALGIRPVRDPQFVVHPNRDPGVYHTGHELLAPYADDCSHALVCFDAAWEGAPTSDAVALARHVETNCQGRWQQRARCVVIDPEIEVWVWSDSPHVAGALGWPGMSELRAWLDEQGLWPMGVSKPPDPEAAFVKAVRHQRLPPSAAIFGQLARTVSFQRCEDASFRMLTEILRLWFPPQ